jgi:hypothetical protein
MAIQLQKINYADKSYYLSTDLFEYNKLFFKGCKGRDVIKKYKLTKEDYIFAYTNNKNEWIISDEKYAKSKSIN